MELDTCLNRACGGSAIQFFDEEAVMKCYRCNGFMVYERFYGEEGAFAAWRCVVCGEIIDHVILKNRYGQKQEKAA